MRGILGTLLLTSLLLLPAAAADVRPCVGAACAGTTNENDDGGACDAPDAYHREAHWVGGHTGAGTDPARAEVVAGGGCITGRNGTEWFEYEALAAGAFFTLPVAGEVSATAAWWSFAYDAQGVQHAECHTVVNVVTAPQSVQRDLGCPLGGPPAMPALP